MQDDATARNLLQADAASEDPPTLFKPEGVTQPSTTELALVADAVPALVAYIDAQERYHFVNRAYETWLQRPRESIVGKRLGEVGGDLYAIIEPHVRRVLAGERTTFAASVTYPDGVSRQVQVSYIPDVADDGATARGFVALTIDASAEAQLLAWERAARAEAERLQRDATLLAEISQALVEAGPDMRQVLDEVTGRVMQAIGDACAIHLLSQDGSILETVTLRHRDPELEDRIAQVFSGGPFPRGEGLAWQAIENAHQILLENIDPEEFGRNFAPERQVAVSLFSVRSYLATPLFARDRVIGVLNLTRHSAGRPYTQADARLAQQIADRAALAIEHARLFEAERNARERAQTLQSISSALAGASTVHEVATVVLQHGLAATGAHGGVLGVADLKQEVLTLLGDQGFDEDLVGPSRHVPINWRTPLTDAFRHEVGVWLPTLEVYRDKYAELALRTSERTGTHAICAIPLSVHGRCLGALGFSFPHARAFEGDERGFLETLAGLCAQALDRARLYDAERTAREQLDTILHGVTDGISVQARDGHVVFANDAAARLVGCSSAEEFVSMPLHEIMSRFVVLDQSGQVFPLDQLPGRRALLGEDVPDTLIRFKVTATGEERVSLVAARPLRDAQGSVQYAMSIFHDVTEQQRAELRLRFLADAGALLPAHLDDLNALDGVAHAAVETIADWAFIYVTEPGHTVQHTALACGGLAECDVVLNYQRDYSPVPGDDSIIWHVLQSGEPTFLAEIVDELLVRSAHDAQHLERMRQLGTTSLIFAPLTARNRTLGVLGFFTGRTSGRRFTPDDVSVAVEIARRAAVVLDNTRLFRELQEAVRARDEFLSIASHELRTPVAGLKGAAQLLARRAARGTIEHDQLLQTARAMSQTTDRLARLTEELLDVSRIQTGKLSLNFTEINTGELLQAVIERASDLAGANYQVALDIEPEIPLVSGDADRLEEVFTNVVDNGIRYSPGGGRVEVRVYRDEGGVRIDVRDHGIGLPPGGEERIFEAFARAENALSSQVPGMGLGLYISRNIVQRHGGRIWAHNEDPGCSFCIWLPLQWPPESARDD